MSKIDELIKLYEQAGFTLLEMLRNLDDGLTKRRKEQLFLQIDNIINTLVNESSDLSADILSEEYKKGSKEAIDGMRKQGMSEVNTSLQSVIHTQAVQAIMDDTFYSILESSDFMSQDAKNRIEEAIKKANQRSLVEGVSRRKATKEAVAELAQTQITGMIAKNGAKIPADKYMAGVVHYHQRKAHVEGNLNRMKENNLDLVYINQAGITCELCAKYQGRVYSLSGNDGRFPALTADRKPPFHSHCIHSTSAYIEDYYDEDDVKQIQLESNRPFTDNRTERNIQKYKRLQLKTSRKNETRKQWIRYKAKLPDEVPDLRTFASLKARNTNKYNELQQLFRNA